MFTYKGTRAYRVKDPIGRIPAQEAIGHHFTDYHQNRHLFIRPLGKDTYHVKMYVRGIVTTDNEMRKQGMQSWAINHLQFQITEALLRVINQKPRG